MILWRPGHRWPLLLALNRDERLDRPWLPPGRHWPDRPEVVGGRDLEGGGTWLGVNDASLVAGVMNRVGSLGPEPGKRTRGELPLKALAHRGARAAVLELGGLDAGAYRAFNMVVADANDAFWLRYTGKKGPGKIQVFALPPGLSMIAASDRNDLISPRIRMYLPLFRAAQAPDPEAEDWRAWEGLLESRRPPPGYGPGEAMAVRTQDGFGTISASTIALPGSGARGDKPLWRFAAGPPSTAPYLQVSL